MIFHSLSFFIFFFLVALIYFLSKETRRPVILFIASLLFYASFFPSGYVLILLLMTLTSYLLGLVIENVEVKRKKKILALGVIFFVSILIFFKYLSFIVNDIFFLLKQIRILDQSYLSKIIVPLGLSFYTLKCISYVIEVYKNKIKAEKNFINLALYIVYFPALISGPIERPQNFLKELKKNQKFDYNRVVDSLKIIVIGIFKKVVIADRLSLFVNQIYNYPNSYTGVPLIVATVFFAFQIYADFSGYSDMVIGFSKILGIELSNNFNQPYLSKSFSEFWSRWHITLSVWFRDYIYIPLGGNRVGSLKLGINLLITFLISGLWHGSSWNFVIWGGLNGLYIIFEKIIENIHSNKDKLFIFRLFDNKYVKILSTFVFIDISWIFFRANNITDSVYILTHSFVGLKTQIYNLLQYSYSYAFSKPSFLIGIFSIILFMLVDVVQEKKNIWSVLSEKPRFVRWFIYYIFILSIFFFGLFENIRFIYFNY